MEHKNHEFSISSWAVDNRITVYIFTLIIIVMGTLAYINMPREDFPEILEKFDLSNKDIFPVIKYGKFMGLISKIDILEAYRKVLKEMVIE